MIIRRFPVLYPPFFDNLFLDLFPRRPRTLDGFFFRDFDGCCEEKEDKYVFNFPLPGFDKKEIEVKVEGNTLEIKAQQEKGKKDEKYFHRDVHGSYSLPKNVDPDNISADYVNGVLKISFPKQEKEECKKIEIK